MQADIKTAVNRLEAHQTAARWSPLGRDEHLANFDLAKGEANELCGIVADLLVEVARDARLEVDLPLSDAHESWFRACLSDALSELLDIDEDNVLTHMEAA